MQKKASLTEQAAKAADYGGLVATQLLAESEGSVRYGFVGHIRTVYRNLALILILLREEKFG